MTDPDEATKLTELVRMGERTMDQQLASIAALQAKNEQSLTVGFTILAAAPTAYAFVADTKPDSVTSPALLLLGLAGLVTLCGVGWLLATTFLAPTRTATGPQAEWLHEAGADPAATMADVRLALLEALPGFVNINLKLMEEGVRRRQVGVALLLGGTALFALAFGLIIRNAT